MSEDIGFFTAQFKSLNKPPILKKERSEEEEAVADGRKEDNQQKDGAEISGDVMASTVTEQCSCSPEGGEDLSAAQLKTQSEPPIADKKRSEERETVVHAETDVKQVMVLETELFEQKGSVVLQRLLRAPRYFNFKGSRWETCQVCGEENHGAAGCNPLEKKKRPCFNCGHYGHNGKYCKKVTGCFICKRRGHLAKDCPDGKTQMLQAQSCVLCLKCGDTGHDMFTCKDGYSSSDLEKIQCWVCKDFGHLLCIDYKDYGPKQVSCYNCGKLGHLGSLASLSCKTGGTGPSCSEGNNAADHTLQGAKNGDKFLLCEDRKSAKVQDLLQQMEKGSYGMVRVVTVDSGAAPMKSFSHFSLVSGDVRDDRERSDVLGSEVALKKISRSRWRKRKRRQRRTVRIAEGGRLENGRQCGMRLEYQSSEEAKPNVLLKPTAT